MASRNGAVGKRTAIFKGAAKSKYIVAAHLRLEFRVVDGLASSFHGGVGRAVDITFREVHVEGGLAHNRALRAKERLGVHVVAKRRRGC